MFSGVPSSSLCAFPAPPGGRPSDILALARPEWTSLLLCFYHLVQVCPSSSTSCHCHQQLFSGPVGSSGLRTFSRSLSHAPVSERSSLADPWMLVPLHPRTPHRSAPLCCSPWHITIYIFDIFLDISTRTEAQEGKHSILSAAVSPVARAGPDTWLTLSKRLSRASKGALVSCSALAPQSSESSRATLFLSWNSL